MVSQGGMLTYLKMYKISDKIINFITRTLENWKVEIAEVAQTQEEVKFQSGIFSRPYSSLYL